MPTNPFSLKATEESTRKAVGQPLTSFKAPRTAQVSFQPSPQQMQRSATSKFVGSAKKVLSRAGGALTANLLGAASRPTQPSAPAPQYSQQFVGPGGLIEPQIGVITPSSRPQAFDSGAALRELQKQASESLAEPTSEAGASSSGTSAPSGGSGTTGPGAGGFTPQGFSKIEEGQEGVDTGQPSPGTVQAQPFTQLQPGGAVSAGGGAGTQERPLTSAKERGFNQALAVMGAGAASNITPAQGIAAVSQYAPTRRNDTATGIVQQDPFLGQLIKSVQDYINPEKQATTLVENYRAMQKELGLEDINEKLISLEKVMRGTEEDIKTEIMRGGGFATSGQVRGLVNARNKTFLEEYSMLQRTLESKEKYLNTLVGLEIQDRESANQRFSQGFSMLFNIAEYQQRAQQYTRDSSRWVMSQIGADGLYNSTGGDPYIVGLLEQELGLPQNGLFIAANQARQVKLQAQQEAQLDLQLKQQQIKTPEERTLELKLKQAQLKKLDADTAKVYSDLADEASGNKKLTATQYQALGYGSRLIQSGNIINEVGNQFAKRPALNLSIFGKQLIPGLLKSADQKKFEQAKKNFVNAVLRRESGAAISPNEFESAEEQYFPKLGDDQGTLQQKLENRNLVSANFLREGGMDTVDPTKLTISPSGELIELID